MISWMCCLHSTIFLGDVFFWMFFLVISLHPKTYTPKRDDSMRSNLLFPPLSLAVRNLRKRKRHELLFLLITAVVVVVVVVVGGGGGGG